MSTWFTFGRSGIIHGSVCTSFLSLYRVQCDEFHFWTGILHFVSSTVRQFHAKGCLLGIFSSISYRLVQVICKVTYLGHSQQFGEILTDSFSICLQLLNLMFSRMFNGVGLKWAWRNSTISLYVFVVGFPAFSLLQSKSRHMSYEVKQHVLFVVFFHLVELNCFILKSLFEVCTCYVLKIFNDTHNIQIRLKLR